jgi:cell division protein FtsN
MPPNQRLTPRLAQQGSARQLLLGLMIGLVVGIGIAAAVAVYVSHIPNPFAQSHGEGHEGIAKAPPPTGTATPDPNAAAQTGKADTTGGGAEKSRFDFYKILPGEDSATANKNQAKPEPAKEAAPVPAQPKPVEAKAAPEDNTVYYLQAGAYQSEGDADNQKAKIALLGLEARVKSATVPDKGTVYRVRLGPFKSQSELSDAKGALQENGITASVIKIVKAAPQGN